MEKPSLHHWRFLFDHLNPPRGESSQYSRSFIHRSDSTFNTLQDADGSALDLHLPSDVLDLKQTFRFGAIQRTYTVVFITFYYFTHIGYIPLLCYFHGGHLHGCEHWVLSSSVCLWDRRSSWTLRVQVRSKQTLARLSRPTCHSLP